MSERPKFTATDRGSLWRSTIVDTVSILDISHNTLRFSRDSYISDTVVNTDETFLKISGTLSTDSYIL